VTAASVGHVVPDGTFRCEACGALDLHIERGWAPPCPGGAHRCRYCQTSIYEHTWQDGQREWLHHGSEVPECPVTRAAPVIGKVREADSGACGDPECHVLHADPSNPIHPPWYVDSRGGTP
jgi:hypothetical protein